MTTQSPQPTSSTSPTDSFVRFVADCQGFVLGHRASQIRAIGLLGAPGTERLREVRLRIGESRDSHYSAMTLLSLEIESSSTDFFAIVTSRVPVKGRRRKRGHSQLHLSAFAKTGEEVTLVSSDDGISWQAASPRGEAGRLLERVASDWRRGEPFSARQEKIVEIDQDVVQDAALATIEAVFAGGRLIVPASRLASRAVSIAFELPIDDRRRIVAAGWDYLKALQPDLEPLLASNELLSQFAGLVVCQVAAKLLPQLGVDMYLLDADDSGPIAFLGPDDLEAAGVTDEEVRRARMEALLGD